MSVAVYPRFSDNDKKKIYIIVLHNHSLKKCNNKILEFLVHNKMPSRNSKKKNRTIKRKESIYKN